MLRVGACRPPSAVAVTRFVELPLACGVSCKRHVAALAGGQRADMQVPPWLAPTGVLKPGSNSSCSTTFVAGPVPVLVTRDMVGDRHAHDARGRAGLGDGRPGVADLRRRRAFVAEALGDDDRDPVVDRAGASLGRRPE